MIETSKESLSVNKLIAKRRETIIAEGDMIVPDSKPDILNTISTSGIVSIYKTEISEEKIRIDGNVNTYIMYIPDGVEDNVRGLNTNLDFSEIINIPTCKEGMNPVLETQLKSIDCKVLNGRKINIKAIIEVSFKIYSQDSIEIINDMNNVENLQMLKEELKVNSLVGMGLNKISSKDTIRIDNIDNLAEILKVDINLGSKDIKLSYNKVLAKSEIEIKIMYLTEDNRINITNSKLPFVGFIDIPNVLDGNICDVNYLIKNIIIKPNPQEEHSIYVEVEVEITCNVYEEKDINIIQDMFIPGKELDFEKKQITTVMDKQNKINIKSINEKINFRAIENTKLIDVDVTTSILKEDKINSKILCEGDINLKFLFLNNNNQIEIKETTIPFDFVVEDLENGETLNSENYIEIKDTNFIVQEGGDIECNIDIEITTKLYRYANISVIDSVEDKGNIENQDYSIIIYVVKKGDSMWNIAKKFGTTVEYIVNINNTSNPNELFPGDVLFVTRFSNYNISKV